jgi:hypothetical protein
MSTKRDMHKQAERPGKHEAAGFGIGREQNKDGLNR